MNEILNREKYREIDRLLDDEFIMLQIDPECKGVDIPSHLRGTPSVTLQLSRLFRGSMEITDSKIEANLLFKGSYYCCLIPYEAIWAATAASGEEKFWPSSIPEAIADQLKNVSTRLAVSQAEKPEAEPTTDKMEEPEESESPPKEKEKKRPNLRLVKG
jgi:stringent starvation protein B